VVAHNEFVPEHEARIGRTAMIGHLVSEWAMDDWLRQKLLPADVLEEAGEHAGALRRARFPVRRGLPPVRSVSLCG
jgi:hypothetical protein